MLELVRTMRPRFRNFPLPYNIEKGSMMSEYNARPLNTLKAVHNFTKAVDKDPDNQVNLNSSGTVGTEKPVHFTEYRGFHISGVLIVHQHTYKYIRDQTKCLQYCRWPLFRGGCMAGFYCICK